MALNRCDNGHYYDPAKYGSCPTCHPAPAAGLFGAMPAVPAAAAPAAGMPPSPDDGTTRRRDGHAPEAAARPMATAGAAADGGRTERLVRRQTGLDPVVGWLVCTGGPERGADYRLHSERNFIGRGEGADVRIASDKTVSRENHVSISFDPKRDSFRLLPGEGRGIVYLNGEELVAPMLLKAGDRIELGETLLLFVPLCGPGFRWDGPPAVAADAG